ncbi:MAG: carbohydrate kinase [Clostridia bacterium]|nr:carbohydrate kinase [Clostridia bacterium]
MILCIGEILADMIGSDVDRIMSFKAFCGGAPFNVAVGARRAGADVGFIGRVGNDPVGKFLKAEALKAGLNFCTIQTDNVRNTTLAFVTLTDGERDFAFYRHDTADFNVDINAIDFGEYEDLNIVHLGSLMLSEENGRALAQAVVDKARAQNKLISFDLNFRMDIYKDFNDALKAYKPFVEQADIIKFSDDELKDYTGKDGVIEGIESIYKKDTVVVVTLGSRGSVYYYNGLNGTVGTEKVKPIDTTGAGDAFFGTFLANIEGKKINKENLESALIKANAAGAAATQFLGAIQL